jgi:hypothetical protein
VYGGIYNAFSGVIRQHRAAHYRATSAVAFMLSLGIANLIFTAFMGHTEIPKTGPYDLLMQSIQVTFVIMAVLCVIGVGISLARGNLRKAQVPPIASRVKKL